MRHIIATRFLAVFLASALMAFAPVGVKAATNTDNDTYKQLNLFGDVFERIRSQYVREVTDEELIEAAINGMLSSLDPHSSFLNAKGFKDMQVQTKGEYGGLGMEVTLDRGVVRVVSPIDDTPASRAGIQSGDYITRLDGEQIMGLSLTEAVDKMKGLADTDITLTVIRKGEKKALEITLTRAIIKIKSVRYRIEDEVGYVRISSFTEKAESGLLDALEKIDAELGDKLQGIVLDLRNNPGGLLDQAIAVSNVFLDRGEIVSTRTRNDNQVQRYPARKGDRTQGKPVIVLINGGSASASEIVAGALQDHNRGVIVGTQSFGKGSVQTIIPLGSSGAMRLTTAYYFTPSGTSIQAEGIVPDVIVEQLRLDKADTVQSNGRSESNLRGSLSNPNGDEETDQSEAVLEEEISNGKKKIEEENSDNKDEDKKEKISMTTAQEDFQLNYALNLLRGLAVARNNN